MLRKIQFKTAVKAMLVLTGLVMAYHLLILLKVVPYYLAWGGRLTSDADMYRFETMSLLINFFIAGVVAMKGGYIRAVAPYTIINIILWLLVVLFVFNTLGNLFAKNIWEAVIFTPLTALSALFCARIAMEKR